MKKICAKWSPDPHSSCWYHRAWQWQANLEYSTKHSVTRESLLWRHNGRNGISNHQPNDCLHNRLFRRGSKKTSSAASLAFLREINRWPVNSPHKRPVTQKMFPFDIVIRMIQVFDYLKLNTMMTSSKGNLFRVTGHLCGEFTGHHKGQWRRALMFSLICVWINVWVNNREAGDLRRYRTHYDVTVIRFCRLNESFQVAYFRAKKINVGEAVFLFKQLLFLYVSTTVYVFLFFSWNLHLLPWATPVPQRMYGLEMLKFI